MLEGRRRGADDPDVDEAYARTLMELGLADRTQEHFDESLVWFQRAEEVLEGLVHEPRHLEAIVLIDDRDDTIAGCSVVAARKNSGGGFWSRTFACSSG